MNVTNFSSALSMNLQDFSNILTGDDYLTGDGSDSEVLHEGGSPIELSKRAWNEFKAPLVHLLYCVSTLNLQILASSSIWQCSMWNIMLEKAPPDVDLPFSPCFTKMY